MKVNISKGATLMETVIAVGMFIMIAAAGTSLLIHAADTGGRIAIRGELLENARITLDFLINQLRLSESYSIKATDGVMDKITVKYLDPEIDEYVIHDFIFNKTSSLVSFGGQRLAGCINTIMLDTYNDCLTITIITQDTTSDMSVKSEPVELSGKVSLKNKINF